MRLFKILFLYPLSLLYNAATSIRNLLFDLKLYKSKSTKVFSIGVGNLTVGGTGKTPVIDYLIKNTLVTNKTVISRGYGRKTKGFLEIFENLSAEEVGDEPKMLFNKNGFESRFFVSESRVLAHDTIMKNYPETNLMFFDDVFQHRYIKPNILILLCDYNQPFFEDHVLPFGRLREARSGAKRADIVLVTKSPKNIKISQKHYFELQIRKYCQSTTEIYFSYFDILPLLNFEENKLAKSETVVLVSALANNAVFRFQSENNNKIAHHFEYSDHYAFQKKDIQEIYSYDSTLNVVCTEKDFVKMKDLLDENQKKRTFISEISLKIWDEEKFKELILAQYLKSISV